MKIHRLCGEYLACTLEYLYTLSWLAECIANQA